MSSFQNEKFCGDDMCANTCSGCKSLVLKLHKNIKKLKEENGKLKKDMEYGEERWLDKLHELSLLRAEIDEFRANND